MSTGWKPAYGTLIALYETSGLRVLVDRGSTANARTSSVIRLLRRVAHRMRPRRGALVFQYDDFAHNAVASVAFGKRSGEAPAVSLAPDPFFIDSQGYAALRQTVVAGDLPQWHDRKNILFWRGAASSRGETLLGSPMESFRQAPRVALCLMMRGMIDVDVAISAPWGLDTPASQAVNWLEREQIFRPAAPAVAQAGFRYLIDIDGVANAWGLMEKLLLGSCILKIASPFEQWYYPSLRPWVHYVPVSEDLSNLVERLDWCRTNGGFARTIANQGQQFALALSLERGEEMLLEAVGRRLIPIEGL